MQATYLEIVGALMVQSLDNFDDLPEEIKVLFERARMQIDDALDNAQYDLWERNGGLGVRIEPLGFATV